MDSLALREIQDLANRLGYFFIVSAENLLDWSYPSRRMLDFFHISGEDLEKNPQCWLNSLQEAERQDLLEEILQQRAREEDCSFSVNLIHNSKEFTLLLHFQKPESYQGKRIRIGSAENISKENRYKKEAFKARDNEIEISARIQRMLLTGRGDSGLKGLISCAASLPSRKVDGDFYEFVNLSDRSVDFIIGDVMGKGISAALLAAAVKAHFLKAIIEESRSTSELPDMERILHYTDRSINRELLSIEKFLTLYYCRMDMEKGLFSFIDAGHTDFLYYQEEEKCCWSVKGADMPMGFTETQHYRRFQLPLKEKDLLLFYSDGITEVENSEGVQFGKERLEQLLVAHRHLAPEELIKKILNLTFFFAADDFKDDVTAVALKLNSPTPEMGKDIQIHFINREEADLVHLRERFQNDLEAEFPVIEEAQRSMLLIAFMEVTANCLNYTEGDFDVQWSFGENLCRIRFYFTGPDFQWYKASTPDVSSYQSHGFGSYLISQAVDSALLMQASGDRKCMILVKEFR